MSLHDPQKTPIAIVGVSAIFPGSVDATGFWTDIVAGRDLIGEVPETHWLKEDYYDPDPAAPDKTYSTRGAFLSKVPFDPMEWGVPPSIVPATDTTQLLALIVAKQVLDDATRGRFPNIDKERISCILGVTSAQELLGTMVNRLQRPIWSRSLRELGYAETEVDAICQKISSHYVPWQESTFPGLLGNVVAGRIANRLDLGGTNCVTDAACASSFSAMSMGINELWLGQSDLVIAGGADTMNDIFMYMCFSKTPALSKSGECRPFSDKADGTLLGEGLGMVALKRLPDAERDGDHVYAVIRGIGSSSDGRAKSVYAPVPQGQAKALRRAYDQAGYSASTVELVEAHGTGTKAGDAAEFEGLRTAFDEVGRAERQWCALGTVKSQIGHTKAAAGAAGLFKILMALHHKVLPPTIKIDQPNPKLEIEKSAFYLNTRTRPWIRTSDHPRRASVSSFGFGGSNFHLTLEEYRGPADHPPRLRTAPTELVVLSAADPAALAAEARAWAGRSDSGVRPGEFLRHAARTTQERTPVGPARLAVVATDEVELRAKLLQLAERIEKAPAETFSLPTGSFYANGATPGQIAFLFPGQGSQYVGMGADLAMESDVARAPFDEAAELPLGPTALQHLIWPRPVYTTDDERKQEDRLRATESAQPAIGAVSLSQLALLASFGVRPDVVGGHSYGEITALHAAGVLSAADMLKVARKRGELMAAAASTDGAMTAIPKRIEDVRAHVDAVPDCVIANHNAPEQVVVSGPTGAIRALEQRLAAAGIEAKALKVATAFHSPIVEPSVQPFAAFLADLPFAKARLPVYANAEAAPYPAKADRMRAILSSAIALPVRFVEQIEAMYAAGVRTFVEVGPGSVLTGLVSDILASKPHTAAAIDRRKKHGITALQLALGRLYIAGVALDFAPSWLPYAAMPDPHARVQPKLAIGVDGSNHGKPYPPKGGARALPKPNAVRAGFAKAQDPAPQIQVIEKVVEKIVQVPVASNALAATAPVGAPVMSNVDPWILAFQEAQRATVDAHTAYQRAMADSHEQFLRTLEQSFVGLARMTGASVPDAAAQIPRATLRDLAPPPAMQVWTPTPSAAPDVASLVQSGIDVLRPSPAVAPAPRAAQAAPAAAVDVEKLLLEVVADKTGYPADMLGMHMALESDLGVDSIKRVEILSAVRERAPGLPEVDAAEMAKLQTLGQVVDHLRAALPAQAAAPAASPARAHTTAPAAGRTSVGASSAVDVEKLLLEVVADKTGYPADMLGMHMALESDLGVDSIKRVEILSAVRERAPGLPEVDAAEMAKLQTLGQVVDHLRASLPASAGATTGTHAAAPAAGRASVGASSAVDVEKLLLEVVADKTGYPADMLGMHMALESDLGVDSIKRVEILSAVRERAPGLPEVDAAEMAKLQTLGQVVDHLRASLPASAGAPAASSAPVHGSNGSNGAGTLDLEPLLLAVVADKTGYPAEMLGMHMALESDLGVDSIKRVEILSAMRERAPGLPEVDASEMAKLQTLGQIVDHLRGLHGSGLQSLQAPLPEPDDDPALGRWTLRAEPAAALGLSQPGLSAAAAITIAPAGPVATALAEALRARGFSPVIGAPNGSDVVVLLHGLGEGDGATADSALRDAFLCAKTAAARLIDGGLFVTVQDTGGDFGVSGSDRAWWGGLSGLAKTAAQEWRAATKAIDLERAGRTPGALAEALTAELLSGGGEPEVGLRADGTRLVLRSVKGVAVGQGSAIARDTVVVATGGARGVTAACLIATARANGGRYALLGRTPLADEPPFLAGVEGDAALKKALITATIAQGGKPNPAAVGKQVAAVVGNREVRATLDAIRAAGAEVRYLSVDVNDPAALSAALDDVRAAWGPIGVVVHAAGVLADKLIAEKTPESFDRVFDTKVKGLRSLLTATRADPLRAIVVFSSVAGRCGNRGQVDYSMANEVLAKVAAAEATRRGEGCVAKALQWGPWEGGMVTPELKAHFASLGVPVIGLASGARMFVRELADRSGAVEIVLGGAPRMEPLASAGAARSATLRIHVDRAAFPYLADHVVAGVPVVPVVMVLEWFARVASVARPDLHLAAFRDVKVLRGLKLEGYEGAGDWFDVSARELTNGRGATLALELRRVGGHPHYAATAELTETRAKAPKTPAIVAHEPWGDRPVYDGKVLFHGDRFQVITSLEGISDRGMNATLTPTADIGWSAEPWHTDPASLDGGLQLALLWSHHVLGGASLPMGVASVRTFLVGSPKGPVTARLTGERKGRDKTLTDIVFVDGAGSVVHEMRGIEAILRPDA